MKLYGKLNDIKERDNNYDIDTSPVKGICPGFVHANYIVESKETKRLRKNKSIYDQNKKMLSRIEAAKPTYSTNDFEKKYLISQYRVNTLCDYRDVKKANDIKRSLSEGS